jgi:SPP1 gp7 family putative phage head morphogenesis protein
MAERVAPAEVERLKTLLGHVKEDMRDYYGQFYGVWREQIVEFAAYEAGWEARANKTMFGVEFDIPARAQLRSAVLSTPLIVEGINKGDLLREFYTDWAKNTVNAVDAIIRGGYYQGLTNTQIARQVFGTAKAEFKDSVWARAQRDVMALTRTAVQHAASQARREVYELNADIVTGVQIVATLDDRTTPLCQSLDGRIFDVGEAPMPPYHIGCRTTTIPVLDPAFAGLSEGATRIARGPDGAELVPADMTYFEWLKTQPAEFQDAAIGPTRGKLLRDGGLTAERFSELNLNRNFEPRTLAEMKRMEPLAFDKIKASGVGLGSNDYGAAIGTVSHVERIDPVKAAKLLDLQEKEVRDAILGVYEEKIKNITNENAYIILPDGNIYRSEGTGNNVSLGDLDVSGAVVTHNHPNGICNFTHRDVQTMVDNGVVELRTVTPGGRFVSLKRGDDKLYKSIVKDMEKAGLGTREMEDWIKATAAHGVNERQIKRMVENKYNEWLSENASKYGYIFTEGRI